MTTLFFSASLIAEGSPPRSSMMALVVLASVWTRIRNSRGGTLGGGGPISVEWQPQRSAVQSAAKMWVFDIIGRAQRVGGNHNRARLFRRRREIERPLSF